MHTSRTRHHHHVNLRVERWHRRCIYAVFTLLALSGTAWLVARYWMRPVTEFGESIHPLEPLSMKVHGGMAMLMLFFLGSLMNAHIRRALKAGRNLVTGWGMICTMLLLVGSGFGLYYLAGEANRNIWSAVHWIVGLAVMLLFVAHVKLGRLRA
jgi:hypothetical protein